MSISNDQTAQGYDPDKANLEAYARIAAVEQARAEIKGRIEAAMKGETAITTFLTTGKYYTVYACCKYGGNWYPSVKEAQEGIYLHLRYGTPHVLFPVFGLIKSAAVAELARMEEAKVAAEEQVKIYKEFYDKFAAIDNKLDKVPIISDVVKHQGNTIDSGIDETKRLRGKIYELSDRLDSCERTNKFIYEFICYAFDPADLQGRAKEMYGLICQKIGHDEL